MLYFTPDIPLFYLLCLLLIRNDKDQVEILVTQTSVEVAHWFLIEPQSENCCSK